MLCMKTWKCILIDGGNSLTYISFDFCLNARMWGAASSGGGGRLFTTLGRVNTVVSKNIRKITFNMWKFTKGLKSF